MYPGCGQGTFQFSKAGYILTALGNVEILEIAGQKGGYILLMVAQQADGLRGGMLQLCPLRGICRSCLARQLGAMLP